MPLTVWGKEEGSQGIDLKLAEKRQFLEKGPKKGPVAVVKSLSHVQSL